MNWLTQYLINNEITKEFVLQDKEFAHLSLEQEAILLVGAGYKAETPLFVVKDDEFKAYKLIELLHKLDDNLDIVFYNQEESLRMEAINTSDIIRSDRILALYKIIKNDYDICITHANASLRKISPLPRLKESIIHLKVNDTIEPDDLIRKLMYLGYERVQYVDRPFTFSNRGGIIDIYSVQLDNPVRIEFFDTEVDSIRFFDIDTQRSIKTVEEIEIIFAKEILLNADETDLIVNNVKLDKYNDELVGNMGIVLENLKSGFYESSMYPLLTYVPNLVNIFSYVENNLKYASTIEGCKRNIRQYNDDSILFLEERFNMNEFIFESGLFSNLVIEFDNEHLFPIYEFGTSNAVPIPWHSIDLAPDTTSNILQILDRQRDKHRIILALDEDSRDEIIRILNTLNIRYESFIDQTKNGLYLWESDMTIGFVIDDINTQIYSRQELIHGVKKLYRYENKFSKAETIHELQDLSINDYVVHRQYGIGQYLGIITKEIDGIRKDFMKVRYKDNDELFVPVENFDLLRKYLSSEAVSVRLSKLGSSTWQRNKDRIKENVKDIADQLIELYALRMESTGFAFSKDSEYQKEFENSFPYPLTNDQKKAIDEIKKDMESNKPMDRLLCGDVGFGKTEVAIRAAFKAVVDKKQVMFLCPTTILSAQHLRTFKKRFENFPVRIEVLNRFVPASKQKEIIKEFNEGKIDILIGTHRILTPSIKPYDLGLLIIDEEQRFGVEHKERIKEFKVSIDVLSLSATPIPRTLQMSLIGLRSLSQLNTPPSNRLPVMTYVIEKNQETIHEIIRKELSRDGQVFYLYNNVEQIYNVANEIQRKSPNAKVAVIHGQMDRNEIEDVMFAFVNNEYNVLVCTTIIETGIDIPNANTIIVDNAHRFGLSQLYQIKGRVGRSDRLAYAYFLVPEKQQLTEVATKRLQAIKEFAQLGSGYKIAMRDLTIRGAGELLGGNQSGFIDTVGMDLYIDLLKEAIALRQGKEVKVEKPIQRVNLEGYLPEEFTSEEGEKLEIYQELMKVESINQLQEYIDKITDQYGRLPNAVELLIEKRRLEIMLTDERVDSFKETPKHVKLVFSKEFSDNLDGIALFELVSDLSVEINISYVNGKISITIPTNLEWANYLIQILNNIKEKG